MYACKYMNSWCRPGTVRPFVSHHVGLIQHPRGSYLAFSTLPFLRRLPTESFRWNTTQTACSAISVYRISLFLPSSLTAIRHRWPFTLLDVFRSAPSILITFLLPPSRHERCCHVVCALLLVSAPCPSSLTLARRCARVDHLSMVGLRNALDPYPTISWLSAGPSMCGAGRSLATHFGLLHGDVLELITSRWCLGLLHDDVLELIA
jgi:hypothetical protein